MKNQRGITLIALVITIIVLLILAGVSIAMLTGDNGILSNAQRSSKETAVAKGSGLPAGNIPAGGRFFDKIQSDSYNQKRILLIGIILPGRCGSPCPYSTSGERPFRRPPSPPHCGRGIRRCGRRSPDTEYSSTSRPRAPGSLRPPGRRDNLPYDTCCWFLLICVCAECPGWPAAGSCSPPPGGGRRPFSG